MNINNDPSKGGNFKPTPAGMHNARIVGIYDLGTQTEPRFNTPGQFDQKERLRWTFECVDTNEVFDPAKGPQPHHISAKKFTKSLLGNSNNLRKYMESLLGRPIVKGETPDMRQFLNMPCLIQVTHTPDKQDPTKVWANITNVMPSMNPQTVAPLRNEPLYFDMDDMNCISVFQKINNKGIKDTIAKSPQFQAICQRTGFSYVPSQPQAPAQPSYNSQYPVQPPPPQLWPMQPQYQQPAQQQPQPQYQQPINPQSQSVQQPWAPPAQPWQQPPVQPPANPPQQPVNPAVPAWQQPPTNQQPAPPWQPPVNQNQPQYFDPNNLPAPPFGGPDLF